MTTYRDNACNEFELPKLTMNLAGEMEAVPAQSGFDATVKAMYSFVQKVLPADYLKEVLDGSKIDDIDIVELRGVYDRINGAYTTALEAGSLQSMTDKLESVAPMLETLEKVTNVDRQINSRQGFKKVK